MMVKAMSRSCLLCYVCVVLLAGMMSVMGLTAESATSTMAATDLLIATAAGAGEGAVDVTHAQYQQMQESQPPRPEPLQQLQQQQQQSKQLPHGGEVISTPMQPLPTESILSEADLDDVIARIRSHLAASFPEFGLMAPRGVAVNERGEVVTDSPPAAPHSKASMSTMAATPSTDDLSMLDPKSGLSE
jgi:hypothetical protein